MASFFPQDLYGGVIRANLPSEYIDSSTLRQIPDHQEVFLSPHSLTSLVFEINQYVSPAATSTQTDIAEPSITTPPASASEADAKPEATIDIRDRAAALYHLRDLIDPHDTLTVVSSPRPVRLQSRSLRDAPAFVVGGRLTTRETARQEGPSSLLPDSYRQSSAQDDVVRMTTTTIRLLLVRLEAYSTDLCVAVNVPWRELGQAGGEGRVGQEEAFADSVLENLVASLDVRDFGLFGG